MQNNERNHRLSVGDQVTVGGVDGLNVKGVVYGFRGPADVTVLYKDDHGRLRFITLPTALLYITVRP